MEFITTFLCKYLGARLTTVIGATIPLIEIKGSILFARKVGLGFFEAFILSAIGSFIIFLMLFVLLKPIINLLKKTKTFTRLALAIEGYISDKANSKTDANSGGTYPSKFTTVLIFVALPLPLTGVWMGTALAVFLGIGFKKSLIAVTIGNLIAGLIVSILAQLLLEYVNLILYALLFIAVILLIIFICKIAIRIKKLKV